MWKPRSKKKKKKEKSITPDNTTSLLLAYWLSLRNVSSVLQKSQYLRQTQWSLGKKYIKHIITLSFNFQKLIFLIFFDFCDKSRD